MARIWARVTNSDGTRTWKQFGDGQPGGTDLMNFMWLQQVILLRLGESPRFPTWGIPVVQTMATQVMPDYYTSMIQSQFASYFGSLSITWQRSTGSMLGYSVSITASSGSTLEKVTIDQSLSQTGTTTTS